MLSKVGRRFRYAIALYSAWARDVSRELDAGDGSDRDGVLRGAVGRVPTKF